jgi:hypothetical protein
MTPMILPRPEFPEGFLVVIPASGEEAQRGRNAARGSLDATSLHRQISTTR